MQVLIWWVLIIGFQLLILHDIKQNLIIDFTKSDLELKLFLIDSGFDLFCGSAVVKVYLFAT